MSDFYGNINWWGFSPALDMQEIGYGEMCKKLSHASPEELHILIVGAGDLRHILKTIARRYRHRNKKLKFYVIENSLELYVRHMLLMMIALEKQTRLGLQEKTELFLEIFGNTHVREQSSRYSEVLAHELIKMVTDFDYLEKKLPMFDLTQLKYKERDFMEGILKFLRNREKTDFDIAKCWELRLRKLLEVRYDSMKNVFDWDYNMEMAERGGSIINLHQYKHWRQFGVAFQIREGTYDVPNRTISSATVFKMNGERYPRRGFWGDMMVSPYVSFGVETEEKSFYKKQNKQHTKTAEDVSEFNINSLFHELATNTKYELPKVEEKESQNPKQEEKLQEITEEEEEEDERQENKNVNNTENTTITKGNDDSDSIPSNQKEEEKSHEKDKHEDETKEQTSISHNTESNNDNTQEDEKLKKEVEIGEELDWIQVDGVKVTFLPLNSLPDIIHKAKFQKLFNTAFFSNSMVHHLKPEISQIFADHAALVLETALFMLDLKKDYVKEFVKKVISMAEKAGFKSLETPDDLQDSYIKFSFER